MITESNYGQRGPMPAAVQEEGPCIKLTKEIGNAVLILEQAINRLESRLEPILRAEPADPENEGDNKGYPCRMEQVLDELVRRINSDRHRLDNITDRIQL